MSELESRWSGYRLRGSEGKSLPGPRSKKEEEFVRDLQARLEAAAKRLAESGDDEVISIRPPTERPTP